MESNEMNNQNQSINQTTVDLLLQQTIQTNQKLDQVQELLTSIPDLNSTLPMSIETVMFSQLKKLQDSQQNWLKNSELNQNQLQEKINESLKQNSSKLNQTITESKMMMDCLGKIAQSEVQKQSKAMVQSFMPEVEVIDNKLMDLSEDISTKAMGINSAMISINDRLIDIHVGKAIWEYILVAFIALALGVFGSLRLVQVFYGQMLKHGYQTEIQLAEKRGKNEYRKSIVENNSGMVELKKLEKGYVQKHRDSYKDPDLYLEGLTTKINELKNNNRFKD